jgi:hypothetical protein
LQPARELFLNHASFMTFKSDLYSNVSFVDSFVNLILPDPVFTHYRKFLIAHIYPFLRLFEFRQRHISSVMET